MGVAVVLFVLAALVEGYVSASSLPYWAKAAVAILSAASIIAYLALGGRGEPGRGRRLARMIARSGRCALDRSDDRVRRNRLMAPERPFRYRPGCSTPGCDSTGRLQDRRDLERRLEP